MKKHLWPLLILAVLTTPAFAQEDDEGCDPDEQDCRYNPNYRPKPLSTIYPWKPFETEVIKERITALTENKNFLWNIYEMNRQGLNKRNTSMQPWGGSYWPLNQGMIANNYHDKDYKIFITTLFKNLNWETNVRHFYNKRSQEVLPLVFDRLEEKDLAKLAPSEKYDLLLGDTSFDLTKRIWAYAKKWGEEKRWGFLTSIDLPDGYTIPKANKLMALWEGICHGWAVASGHSPRPQKTVWVELPDGRRLPFFPNDIKALVSLMWANSLIQDNIIFEGNRCNKKRPHKDDFGRYIDVEVDRNDTEVLPRCADVHPAIFHTSMINILGIEGRSFVVDKTAEAAVANQPVAGYELQYFNPKSGKIGTLEKSILAMNQYHKDDKFLSARNPETTHVVGVHMKLFYVDWEFPKRGGVNSPADDKLGEMEFNYDLEMNAHGEIIGGQWRVQKDGNAGFTWRKTGQPDFFWVVPKNWKSYFTGTPGLPEWDFEASTLPPQEYLPAAHAAHNFMYEESRRFGNARKCQVFNKEGEMKMVDCEFRTNRPQPLIQVVNKLLELSSN